ncbi:Decapping nuclease DXO like [Pseudolycoriella hygida]|uniref:Decapping nuclease n=1 Tax=Pseudolycoriella hygida TaxID=35572 RepID=A0A9Q0MVS0_9DIPT|nr:Decapping nuclease DXO like [Pseudolycoriella hygida]
MIRLQPIQVRMVVCIHPRREDFDETTQVMKFAEMTQEVQIARPTPMKTDLGYTPGRRKANQIFKMAIQNMEDRGITDAKKLDIDIGLVYSLGPKFPEYRLISPETDEIVAQLMQYLDQRIQKRATLLDDFKARQNQHRMQLVRTEQEINMLRSENSQLNEMLKKERNRTKIHEENIGSMEFKIEELTRKLRERGNIIKDLQEQNNQKQCLIKKMEMEEQRLRHESKASSQVNQKLVKEYKQKDEAINEMENIVRTANRRMARIHKITGADIDTESIEEPVRKNKERSVISSSIASTPRTNKFSGVSNATPRTLRGVPVANVRHRRSRSTDERWLEHRPPNPVPLGTIFQPYYKARKSITKLTDAKDLINIINENREYLPDTRNCQYVYKKYRTERVHYDLNEGLENVIRKPESADNEKINHLLEFIVQNKQKLKREGPQHDQNRYLSTDIVCFRGLLRLIMCTPYEEKDAWIILATKYKGTIYLCARYTEKQIRDRQNQSETQKRIFSYGFKFEQFILTDKPSEKPATNVPVNEAEEFCCMFTTTLNGQRILYGAEMDGIECEEPYDLDKADLNQFKFMEVKVKLREQNPWQKQNYFRLKLRNWWCQSFLVNIKKIIVGTRDPDGIVDELSTVDVRGIPKQCQKFWQPDVCMEFCSQFLRYVANEMNNVDSPYDVFRFDFDPKNSDFVYMKTYNGQNEFSFLPEWYIQEVESQMNANQR